MTMAAGQTKNPDGTITVHFPDGSDFTYDPKQTRRYVGFTKANVDDAIAHMWASTTPEEMREMMDNIGKGAPTDPPKRIWHA